MKKRPFRLALVLLLVFALWLVASLFGPLAKPANWKIFVISEGTSIRGLAQQLKNEQLVSASGEKAFVAAAVLTGWGRKLQPGHYRLSPSLSPWRILSLIAHGKVYTQWITVPEGYNLYQIAALVEAEGIGKKEDFLALAKNGGNRFSTAFPKVSNSLEGYLFPDTYQLDGSQREQELIDKMLARFDEIVWKGLLHADPDHGGRSLHQILTLSSLVEGEAKLPQERPLIAGVLANRLRIGMRLECDATVQYALGDHKPRLSLEDLKVDSPYNTYLNAGLPPGPINNPGRASIRAAMQPAQTPYLFYVAKPDGSHLFSRTYAEHRAAIAQIRRN